VRALIVGGGYIGLECAEQLINRGIRATVVEAQDQIMGPLDPEVTRPIQVALEGASTTVILGDAVARIESAGYYPDAAALGIKLVFAPQDGRLLGAQAVGRGDGVDKRLDVLATAIQRGLTVEDLEHLDLCYAPRSGLRRISSSWLASLRPMPSAVSDRRSLP
jgi:NADPH-dependent 2,4-dienoyl-CoA reductase/sulfur reductase-like enzyme